MFLSVAAPLPRLPAPNRTPNGALGAIIVQAEAREQAFREGGSTKLGKRPYTALFFGSEVF
jgi:hypothetical protein